MSTDPALANTLKDVAQLKEKVAELEQRTNPPTDSPRVCVQRLLDCIQKLLQDSEVAPGHFRSRTRWAEVFDLVEDLRELKQQLPGVYRSALLRLKEASKRLQDNPQDRLGIFEVKRLEKQLQEAAQ